MQLIDTHSHIDTHHFNADFHDVLNRSRNVGVIAQVLPGVCKSWWSNLLDVCDKEPDLYPAIGLHPMYLEMHHSNHLDTLQNIAQSGKLVAIGEIGLDYFFSNSDKSKQQDLFEQQIDIAKQAGLPLILHVRKAHDQVQSTLRKKNFHHGGFVHAFSGSLQQAKKYLDLGFKISFGGTLTYDRARKIRSIAVSLPLKEIVLETDAPDIPPANHHGERNSPEYLPEIAHTLASLRKESFADIAQQTVVNTCEIVTLHNHCSL